MHIFLENTLPILNVQLAKCEILYDSYRSLMKLETI